jgi:hypothetical protein
MAKAKAKAEEIGKKVGSVIGKEIDKEMEKENCGEKKWHHHSNAGGGNAVYGLGFIGALVYFIQTATGFWVGVLGVLKAFVWPAILIYKLLGMAGL